MNNREEIAKLVRGELTYREAEELENRLHSRTGREIIEDLKELPLQNLLDTKDCIIDGIKNNTELDTNETRKSLRYLEIAIEEKIN